MPHLRGNIKCERGTIMRRLIWPNCSIPTVDDSSEDSEVVVVVVATLIAVVVAAAARTTVDICIREF